MKRYNKYLAASTLFLSGIVMLAGCEKENISQWHGLKISVEKYKSEEKTSVEGVNVHWQTNDAIRINGEEYHVTVDEEKIYVSDFDDFEGQELFAYSPYSMSVTDDQTNTPTVTFPRVYNSSYVGSRQIIDLPMVAHAPAGATEILFQHLSATMMVRVKNSTGNVLYIDSVVIRSPYQLSGQKQINLNNSNLGLTPQSGYAANDADKYVSVVFAENAVDVLAGEVKDVQVPFIPMKGGNMTITVYTHNSIEGLPLSKYPHVFQHKASSPQMDRNKLVKAQINISINSAKVTSKYYFDVAPNKRVYFSKGNLQYSGTSSSPHWEFASNQWDTIGRGNIPANTGTNDFFGWASTGNDNGQGDGYVVRYTGPDSAQYRLGGATGNISDYPSADWGYNPISNGGNMTGFWRTLTYDEWNYLFNSRGYSSSRKGLATVNGNQGLVLLPNGEWNLPSGLTFTSGMSNFNQNSYTSEQWEEMEANGAIFLPVTCFREGSSFSDNGAGVYWTATRYDEYNAYAIFIKAGTNNPMTHYNIRRGQAVRLVRDVE